MKFFIPLPEKYLSLRMVNDQGSLHLILLIGVIALGWILLLRWFRTPMGAVYWLVGSLPFMAGTLWGLYQIHRVFEELGRAGWAHAYTVEDKILEGILTIHCGLFLSAILYTLTLCFHVWDFFFPYKRISKGDSAIITAATSPLI